MKLRTLVIGGTGTIGQSLVELLQKGGQNFKVMTRSEEKAAIMRDSGVDVVMGALGDWPTIDNILEDIDQIFLVTSPHPRQVEWQNGLIDRAKGKGILKIVKVSVVGAEAGSDIHLSDWHGQTEDHLRESGIDHVILRPHSFMQNMLMNIPTIKEQGNFYQSLGETKIPFIDTRDIAKAAYKCLTSTDYDNGTYEVTGPTAVDYNEFANALSKETGLEIKAVAIPPEAHNQGMKAAGLPDWLADDLTAFNKQWIAEGASEPSEALEIITNAHSYTIQDFARDYADDFKK